VGRELFFSDLTNCRLCHLANPDRLSATEPFTNFEYHNIGVPVNPKVLENLTEPQKSDVGAAIRPEASRSDTGKFRVPSLRNVAVTAPYMHNGVFASLEAAVLFYGRHLVEQSIASINPETGRPWRAAEVAETVEQENLVKGQPLDLKRTRQLVAFLKTLTDRRYEHLVEP
jgi:cytochrome c peroxidase